MKTTSLILRFGSLALTAGILVALAAFVKEILKYKTLSFSYLIVSASLLTLSIVPYFFGSKISETLVHFFSQTYVLLLGITNLFITPLVLPWYDRQRFIWKVLFCLVAVLLTMLMFTFGLERISGHMAFSPTLFAALAWFIFPLFIMEFFEGYERIPSINLIEWVYPSGRVYPELEDKDLLDPIVISFVLKRSSEEESIVFRSKAPVRMDLGRLFFYFLDDYNAKHPAKTIDLEDGNGSPFKWTFVKEGTAYFRRTRGLDPYISVRDNDIVENDVIVCKRNRL